MKVVLIGSIKFFPTQEFKTGETVVINRYEGKVDSSFNHPDDHKVEALRGKPKKAHRFHVQYKDKEYQLDMNKESMEHLIAGLGDESDNWIGKTLIGEVFRMPTKINQVVFKPVVFEE